MKMLTFRRVIVSDAASWVAGLQGGGMSAVHARTQSWASWPIADMEYG